ARLNDTVSAEPWTGFEGTRLAFWDPPRRRRRRRGHRPSGPAATLISGRVAVSPVRRYGRAHSPVGRYGRAHSPIGRYERAHSPVGRYGRAYSPVGPHYELSTPAAPARDPDAIRARALALKYLQHGLCGSNAAPSFPVAGRVIDVLPPAPAAFGWVDVPPPAPSSYAVVATPPAPAASGAVDAPPPAASSGVVVAPPPTPSSRRSHRSVSGEVGATPPAPSSGEVVPPAPASGADAAPPPAPSTCGNTKTNVSGVMLMSVCESCVVPHGGALYFVPCRRTQSVGHEPLRRQASSTTCRPPQPLSAQAIKHIWVRTALFEKVLDKIVQYMVDNSSKYYEREALMHDSVFGPILAALLVGPCALEYTKLKTSDHFWTDPSANELVQRHRIHGAHRGQDVPTGRRPALGIRKRQSSGSMSEDRFAASAREYVESLHQNSRTHLLYGKNNVLVQPKKDMEVLRGYLSLHQAGENLTLKWTPNQLINGTLGDCDLEKSIYWDYALTVPLRQIVCIHCHQRPDCGGTLVLVSQDGIQRPPLHFPPGGHLLAFLSCLETGLLPRGQLEPPLWSQKGKGKVFPKLRKRSSTARLPDQDRTGEEQTAADYVFRIVYPGYRYDAITINYHHTTGSRAPSLDDDEEEEDRLHAMISMICSRNLTDPNVMKDHGEMMEMQGFGGSPSSWQQSEVTTYESLCQSCSSAGGGVSFDYPAGCTCIHDPADIHTVPLKMLCQNMKRQIVSRAFYG
ncbi:small G protein signaling modulator 2-like, partial [Brachyistius frenatus]|uniref:small G protein signaling modulator 2-like n=1 Tax=Brachyistius frenatus TaxID=100188 RepID=UPI0037E8A66E